MGRETGGRFNREGTNIYLWLIHDDVWQKPTQFCKVIIFQLKNRQIKKKKSFRVAFQVVLVVKNLSASAGDARNAGSIPGSGRSTGGGQGNPLQYS